MSTAPIQIAGKYISDAFDLDETKVGVQSLAEEEAMDRLLFVLTHQVKYLMDHNIERLKWILYRIDVPERDLMQALGSTEGEEPERIIAKMIIERQVEKARVRQQYSSGETPDWQDC